MTDSVYIYIYICLFIIHIFSSNVVDMIQSKESSMDRCLLIVDCHYSRLTLIIYFPLSFLIICQLIFGTVPPAAAFEGTSQAAVISIVSVGIILAAVVVGSFFVLQMCDRRNKDSAAHQREGHHHPHYGTQAQSLLPTVNFDSLKLISVIGNLLALPLPPPPKSLTKREAGMKIDYLKSLAILWSISKKSIK